jgi:hypothetical protein
MSAGVVRYADGGGTGWGVVRGDRVVPLPGGWATTAEFLADGAAHARALPEATPATALALRELACSRR